MEKEYYTEGVIKKVMAGTVDEGKVYDQNIIFELENGTKLELFDYNMLVDSSMVGRPGKFLIRILDSEFPETLRRKKSNRSVKSISYDKGFDIRGEIIDKRIKTDELTKEECIVDFGGGNMLLNTNEGEFRIGDFVFTHAFRLDIVAVFNNDN